MNLGMSRSTKVATPTGREVRLTDEQQKAIDLMPQHNLQIIACAGSGKTEIVARGIAEIIRQGVKPSEIVAFTFTEKAAEEMKARIRSKLARENGNEAALADMYVGTIHSYCFEELQRLRPEYRSYDVLDEASRIAYVSKPNLYFNKLKLKRLELRGKGRKLKRYTVISRFIRTADLVMDEQIGFKKIRRDDPELAESLAAYQEALRHDRYMDFATMIHNLVQLLKTDAKSLKELHAVVRHLVVDEYQDINGLQEQLIRLMTGPKTKIAVVGDDDQSIYWWRGSVVGHLIDFKTHFKNVETANLEANFRSSRGIVALANDFISRNRKRLPKKMAAANPHKTAHARADIQYKHFKDEKEQARFITGKIKELAGADFNDKNGNAYGLSYGDMAVLIRSNSDIKRFLPFLEEAKIQYVVDSGEAIFEQEIVLNIIGLLDAVFRLDTVPMPKLVRNLISYFKSSGYKSSSESKLSKQIVRLRSELDRVKAKGPKDYLGGLGLQGVYHDLLEAAGIREAGLSDADHYYLATLSRAISDYETVWQRLRHLEYKYFRGFIHAWGQHSYSVEERSETLPMNRVKVMTVHKAKGLEFPVVFMPYLNRKSGGGRLDTFLDKSLFDAARYAGGEEEERRVNYVAMTRAEKHLFLSGMCEDADVQKPREPAEFIGELNRELLSAPEKLKPKKSGLPPRKRDEHEFATTFSDLACFGRCGYDYKLRQIYGYNAGVPAAFGYGTQIHNILNILHQDYRDGNISESEIDKLVNRHFHLRYAPGNINRQMQEAAKDVIRNYVRDHSREFKRVLETEKGFELSLDKTLVTGRIDLIKKMDEKGSVFEVELVDFKSERGLAVKPDFEHQLRVYVLASGRALGLTPRKAVIHELESGEKKEIDIAPERLAETAKMLGERVDGIRAQRFDPVRRKEVCSDCDFTRICAHCRT